jgi:IrrE N-terminal-like domain
MIAVSEHHRSAAKTALKVRTDAGYLLHRPCNVYDLITKKNIDLQFVAIPTLEGMYLEDDGVRRICVSALRPPGRQCFTAAHELGHAALTHGTKVDTIDSLREGSRDYDVEERLADTFAASLLMPNGSVHSGFRTRGIDIQRASAPDVYGVAKWLGVGYSTLIQYLHYPMRVISDAHFKGLSRVEPKEIKSNLIREVTVNEVFQLDRLWDGESVQGQVGDFFTGIAADPGPPLRRYRDGLLVGSEPGEAEVALTSGGSVTVKISRKNYVGFFDYRYLREEK